jgi:cbb3-type cytochrome oxidase maturation protein
VEIIYYLIGFSLFIALIFLGSFIWAVKNGQYDDKHTPAMRMLFDNHKKNNNSVKEENS